MTIHVNTRWVGNMAEYQLIYILGGKGILESESFNQAVISPGALILLFLGETHRYKPSENAGLEEYQDIIPP